MHLPEVLVDFADLANQKYDRYKKSNKVVQKLAPFCITCRVVLSTLLKYRLLKTPRKQILLSACILYSICSPLTDDAAYDRYPRGSKG